MPSWREIYRTPLLSAKNLGKRTIVGEIEEIYPETISTDSDSPIERLIIELEQGSTRIALNKGNATNLATAFGEDWTDWRGKKISVRVHTTQYMGKAVDGLLIEPAIDDKVGKKR